MGRQKPGSGPFATKVKTIALAAGFNSCDDSAAFVGTCGRSKAAESMSKGRLFSPSDNAMNNVRVAQAGEYIRPLEFHGELGGKSTRLEVGAWAFSKRWARAGGS